MQKIYKDITLGEITKETLVKYDNYYAKMYDGDDYEIRRNYEGDDNDIRRNYEGESYDTRRYYE